MMDYLYNASPIYRFFNELNILILQDFPHVLGT